VPLFDVLPVAPRFNDELACTIRAGRERLGLSQAEFGARLGVRQPHVANVERAHDRLSSIRAKYALHLLDQTERIAA
jgi:transcriptional regulator with XRE-family HTH domain